MTLATWDQLESEWSIKYFVPESSIMNLRSEMSTLIILSDVWISEEDNKYYGETLYSGFNICTEVCDPFMYIFDIWEARDS